MAKVIMGIGIPGSGKTTLLKEFSEKNGYSYICPDNIREELTGNAADQTRNPEVWQIAYERLAEQLGSGQTVVFDSTLTDPERRTQFIDLARQNGAEKIYAVHADVPLETAKERNVARERVVPEHVLDMMDKNLEDNPPSVEEGVDMVFTFDEYQKLLEAERMHEGKITHKSFNRETE